MSRATATILIIVIVVLVILGIYWMADGNGTYRGATDAARTPGTGTADVNAGASAATSTGPSPTSSGAAQEASRQVAISNFAYSPATVRIQRGMTVIWTNQDTVQHDVTSDTGAFRSPLLDRGDTFSQTFTTAGTYTYHCSPHPNMRGTVIVE